MTHWLDGAMVLLTAKTSDLRELARIVDADPEWFYSGINLDRLDVAGQDLSGMRFRSEQLKRSRLPSEPLYQSSPGADAITPVVDRFGQYLKIPLPTQDLTRRSRNGSEKGFVRSRRPKTEPMALFTSAQEILDGPFSSSIPAVEYAFGLFAEAADLWSRSGDQEGWGVANAKAAVALLRSTEIATGGSALLRARKMLMQSADAKVTSPDRFLTYVLAQLGDSFQLEARKTTSWRDYESALKWYGEAASHLFGLEDKSARVALLTREAQTRLDLALVTLNTDHLEHAVDKFELKYYLLSRSPGGGTAKDAEDMLELSRAYLGLAIATGNYGLILKAKDMIDQLEGIITRRYDSSMLKAIATLAAEIYRSGLVVDGVRENPPSFQWMGFRIAAGKASVREIALVTHRLASRQSAKSLFK